MLALTRHDMYYENNQFFSKQKHHKTLGHTTTTALTPLTVFA